jgi:flavin-dependent dehydrogenase
MSLSNASDSVDVFIAGGGPAGLAAAIAAAQRGFSVMVADAARPPIDKACGEGIMPEGVEVLGALGVELSAMGAARLEGICFLDAAGEVRASFPRGTGLGVRRTALHGALVARAERMGVRLAWGTRVEAIRQGEAVAGGSTVRCRFVVCADGLNSSLRQMAGFGPAKARRRRFGFRSHYRVPPWSPYVEVYWGEFGQIYITPVSTGEICVALLTSNPHARLETVLLAFPCLRERLLGAGEDARGDERRMGGITATSRLRAVTSGRIAVIGDASGSADAITGDGLSLAFQQAIALADAMAAGAPNKPVFGLLGRDELDGYQRAHERISRLPRAMGELLLLLDGRPRLRRRVFSVFAQSPELFARLLALHTGGISPLDLGAVDCLRFGWKLLGA